ncbi:MAG: hypothetical protein PF485_06085 [Bacteroidales bacterium]|jgi:putative iron-only hydrogenase system regulator|nr:hypothetical protein [Bacteroidales bacterium]
MEKRIGTALILIEDTNFVQQMNEIAFNQSNNILGRQGLPRGNGQNIISFVLEGTTDEIGSLTGQLGRLKGIQVKSVLLKNKGDENY